MGNSAFNQNSGAVVDATYITTDDQTGNFANSVSLGDLTSGVLKQTVAAGVSTPAISAGLTSIDGLTTAADKMIYTTALDTYAVTDLTSFARMLLDDTTAGDARTTLGLGTMAVEAAADYLALSGGTMTGLLTLSGAPTDPLHAATKQYVDMISAGFDVKDPCLVATTANLTATYDNGVSGVGATLTNSGAMAAFSTDGVSPPINSRVLVKNQSTPAQNGIYTLTTVGSGAANWVLTRAVDYDDVTEIDVGDFIIITSGTANANSAWIQTATVATIGTDALSFSQFGAADFATRSLGNLSGVAINESLISDTDINDDLGSASVRWTNTYTSTVRTGDTAADTLLLQARDVDGASWVTFMTLTANNDPTCLLSGNVTSVTQSASDNSTKLATTEYVENAVAAAGGASLVLLGSATASASATVDFDNLISATYDSYLIICDNVLPVSDGVTSQMRVGTGATPTYQSSGYSGNAICYAGATAYSSGTGALDISLTSRTGNDANRTGGGSLWIKNANGSTDKIINSEYQVWDSTGTYDNPNVLAGRWQSATVITSVQFLMSSGNISTGTYYLYGLVKS